MPVRPPDIEPQFPPRDGHDVLAYEPGEVLRGYRDFGRDDPEPGPNRSAAFRWGWRNACRDRRRDDDGFDGVRRSAIQLKRIALSTTDGRGSA